MAELCGELYDRLLDAAAVRREIERAIASLGEERLRLLLEYRYIDGLTLEAAAERMHYSWRQAANLHRQALSELLFWRKLRLSGFAARPQTGSWP